MYEFDVNRPKTLADAVAALQDEDAVALGGGQTLIPTMKQRLAMPQTLVALKGVPELFGITVDEGAITIGGATIHAEVAQLGKHYPALAKLVANIGDRAVRSRGTIGGSLANNDPAACYPAAVLASQGVVVTDRRRIACDDYFQGLFETALEKGEIVTQVQLTIPTAAAYEKFVQPASRFALVGVFVARFAHEVRVAVTGAHENGVFRWLEAEAALHDQFDAASLETVKLDSADMIEDLHGSAAYRAHLVGVMAKRAVMHITD